MEPLREILEILNNDQNLNSNNIVEKIKQEFEKKRNELYLKYDTHKREYNSYREAHESWKESGFSLDYLVRIAVRNGYINILKAMIDAGGNVNGDIKYTPLHQAVEDGRIKMVEFLFDNGANINAKSETSGKETPLSLAVSKACYIYPQGTAEDDQKYIERYVEIIKFLIARGADINESDPLGWTVGKGGSINLVKLLVENGAVILDGHLHSAANDGNTDIAGFLIDHGADLNCKNEQGDTPLHRAAIRFKVDTIKLMVAKGAKVDITNNIGQTPLHTAAHLGSEKTILALIELGSDPWVKDNNGATPIDHYVYERQAWQSRVDWGFTQDRPRKIGYLMKLKQACDKDLFVRYSTMVFGAIAAVALFATDKITPNAPHIVGAVAIVTAAAFAAGRIAYEIFKPSTKMEEVRQEPNQHGTLQQDH